MANVLEGITVIDLTQNVAGPYCTQVLGDLGADIIKVERLEVGDDTRQWNPPAWEDESATFLGLNRNKKSICIDLNNKKGQDIIKKFAAKADVFVHSMKPGSLEARGLGHDDLTAENPNLIYSAISAFGEEGPLKNEPGYDPLIQAYAGIMSVTGNPEDDPARVGVSIIDMATGMWAVIGILSAIIKRNQTNTGSNVSNSLLETGVAWISLQLTNYMATGKVPKKIGTAAPMIAPYEAFKAKDGWVIIAAGNNRLFKNLCEALDLISVSSDERFQSNGERIKNRSILHNLIENATQNYSSGQLIQILKEKKVPCSGINTLDKVYADEQIRAQNMIKAIDNFRIANFKMIDLPFTLNHLRGDYRFNPPSLGEHTDEILKEIHLSSNEVIELKENKIIE